MTLHLSVEFKFRILISEGNKMKTSPKKILIINSYFEIGGIESALVNMVNSLCEFYDIDILAYNPVGPMKDKLAPGVNIIKPSFALKALAMTPKQAFATKNLLIILFKIFGALWTFAFDNRLPVYLATMIQPKLKGYDLAIAYRGEPRKKMLMSGYVRILDRCVKAKKKVVWIHFDAMYYKDLYAFNEKYYKRIDEIIGVSKSVAEKFKKANPGLSDKVNYCPNFMDYKSLFELSNKIQQTEYPQNKFVCFSACRLSEEKGLLRAVSVLSPILKEHEDVVWYIAGDGPERNALEGLIVENGLEGRIILLGNQTNPYTYMKNADLYLSMSYHEAAPVVYGEAKALHVPVFSTETTSAYEMLNDGEEDFICENSEEGIRSKFDEIMKNRDLIRYAKESLAAYSGDNEKAVSKFSDINKHR